MPDKEKETGYSEHTLRLADIMGKLYYRITEVSLPDGQARVFKNQPHPEYMEGSMPWMDLLREDLLRDICPEDRRFLMRELSMEQMHEMLELKEDERRFEVRVLLQDGTPQWVEIELSVVSYSEKRILITTRNIEEHRLLQNIVKLYVYRNCDYFIFLDVRNNRYEMLWGQYGVSAVPPSRSEDYISDFMNYIDTYVATEDRTRMKQEILPRHILEVLEKEAEHTYLYGLIDPERGYTRKRLQYIFYDKPTQTVLLTRTDVTNLYLDAKRQNEVLRLALRRAQIDPLTGVYNHQTVSGLIRGELSAQADVQGALLFIDLDNFKGVNDIQGHPEGDLVLRYVAGAMQSSVRHSDLIGRIGGDEFVVFLVGLAVRDEIARCAGRMCDAIRQYPNHGISVTCSIGIALSPQDGRDFDTLLRKADMAMYYAKGNGKNSFAFWDQAVHGECP